MQPHDYVAQFIGAADDDLFMVDAVIDDQAAPDSGIGFHCQQATEKLTKAVLPHRGVHFQWGHDLRYLFDLVSTSGTPVPTKLVELANLNPFAVVLRYSPSHAVPSFDRRRVRELIGELRVWVTAEVNV